MSAYLLLANLTIPAASWLPLQSLYAALEHVAERAGVRDEVFELLGVALRCGIVGVVQRAAVQVRYPRHVVVVRAELVLDGGDLGAPSDARSEESRAARRQRARGRTSL